MITLWADKETLEGSAEAGDRLSAAATQASGSKRRSLESYEVTLMDLPR